MKKLTLTILCSFLFFGLYSQGTLDSGLVAFYQLDGNAQDAGPNGLHGNLFGAQNDTNRKGEPNKALRFNGSSNFISVAHNNLLNLTGNKTISVWYKITDTVFNLYPTLIHKPGQGTYHTYSMLFTEEPAYGSNKNKIAMSLGKTSNVNVLATTQEYYKQHLNQWINITASYSTSDGYMRIYFNGQLSGSTYAGTFTPALSTDSLQIGRAKDLFGNYNGLYFNGLLDDIRLYNRALDSSEIMQLYTGTNDSIVCHHYDTINVYDTSYVNVYDTITVYDTIGVCSEQINLDNGLVAFYPLDGNAQDAGPHGFHGNLFGAQSDTNRYGEANKALKFDGANDFINVAHDNLLNLTGDKTISVWYKITDSVFNLYPTLIHKPGQGTYHTYSMLFTEEPAYGPIKNKIVMSQGKASNVNIHVATQEYYRQFLNQWVNITASYSTSDGYMRIYFNGELSGTTYAGTFTPATSTDSLQIGRGKDLFGNYKGLYFNGLLDDIRLYNRALNTTEIRAIYNGGDSSSVPQYYDTVSVYDTTYINVYDTIHMNVYDTISVYDTTYTTVYDSISVTDTLIITLTITSLPSPGNINTIKIYPNPASTLLMIDYGSPSLLTGYKLLIINDIGQTVHNTSITQPSEQIDLSTYSKGLYYVVILDDNGNIVEHRKIILQ